MYPECLLCYHTCSLIILSAKVVILSYYTHDFHQGLHLPQKKKEKKKHCRQNLPPQGNFVTGGSRLVKWLTFVTRPLGSHARNTRLSISFDRSIDDCSCLVTCGSFFVICLIFNMATTEETLAEYEKLFAKRFTSEDEEYMKTVNRPQASPPCLTDWLNTGYRDR